ncbi:Mite group 2 allergen Eur m 2 [Halotydeus destructor]|nr:Mite group 2 allergen Eur m 2 [Halotydeus destructor]
MKYAILLTFLFATAAQSLKIAYDDCGNGEIQWVDVEPCTEEPCQFDKGITVSVKAAFIANQNTKAGDVSVTINIEDMEIEYPGVETDLCKIMTCPLVKGQTYVADYKIVTADYLPEITTTLTVKANGENGPLACANARAGLK